MEAADKKGERRVSETTINHRPPLPPSISGRSQSLDGLLDDKAGEDDEDEGALDVVDGPSSRRTVLEARSLEVLLDETEDQPKQVEVTTMTAAEVQKVKRPPRREERAKSVDNYLGDSRPRTRSPSEKFCESETLIVQDAKELPSVVLSEPRERPHSSCQEGTAYNSEEEGPIGEQEQEQPQISRQNSTTSSELPERKKTFINRLGKQFKSLIKK